MTGARPWNACGRETSWRLACTGESSRRRDMKAVVFHAVGDVRLDDVPEP
ncbi:MAG: hypothetical protein J0I07_27455, partial [Myxococcales bacterium]|nr:hypothetical protein [Myxococcales bacterium]